MLKGHVKIWKNGELISEASNSIENDLRDYLVDELNSPVDRAIDNLFTTMGQDGSQATGEDGIMVVRTDGGSSEPGVSAETVYIGSQIWEGTYTNTSGSDETIYKFRIGHNFQSVDDLFEITYAIHIPGAGILLNDQDSVIINWQIEFEAA